MTITPARLRCLFGSHISVLNSVFECTVTLQAADKCLCELPAAKPWKRHTFCDTALLCHNVNWSPLWTRISSMLRRRVPELLKTDTPPLIGEFKYNILYNPSTKYASMRVWGCWWQRRVKVSRVEKMSMCQWNKLKHSVLKEKGSLNLFPPRVEWISRHSNIN